MSVVTRTLQPVVNGLWRAKQMVVTRYPQQLSLTKPAGWKGVLGGGGRAETGRIITDEDLMMTTPFFSGVRLICETIGSLPLNVMRKTDDIDVKATDHPLYKRLKQRPNQYQTASTFIEAIVFSLVMWNQAYVRNDGFGSRANLRVVIPSSCNPETYNNGQDLHWRVIDNGRSELFELGEIIPIDGMRWPGALEGMRLVNHAHTGISRPIVRPISLKN